jgi:hypothetical protein
MRPKETVPHTYDAVVTRFGPYAALLEEIEAHRG